MADYRTPIGRVRGLGAAKSGSAHWLHQRITAIANLLLVIWFVASLVRLAGADYATVIWWMRDPVVTVLLVALIANLFYHLWLGLKVPIEDYVKNAAVKLTAVIALTFATVALALLGIVSVLQISLGG